MSHISVDLKVIEVRAPMVARACEQSVTHIVGGLSLLWHRCWSTKTDTITRVGLAGIFGPKDIDALIAALVDAGFLEVIGDSFRVKGADKYLRIRAGNAKGGHASKSNLIPGPKPKTEPKGSRRPTRSEPEEGLRLGLRVSSALTPSTEHRAPIETSAPTASTPAAQSETELLRADFQQVIGSPYLWQGAKDGVAFANLKKLAPIEEIRRRWCRGLRAASSDWASCRTVAQLASKWNDLAADAKTEPAPRGSVHPKTRELL